MTNLVAPPKTKAAIWSTRLAFFAIFLIVVSLLLHRFAGYPTGLLLNTLKVAFALAAGALVLGVAAIIIIWRKGKAGSVRAVAGLILAALIFAWPAFVLPTAYELPMINDITTDPVQPPQFEYASQLRGLGANSTIYPGLEAAAAQAEFYPYIKPIIVDRSIQEAFELVRQSVQRLNWDIVAEQPPRRRSENIARIEATDKTVILGFVDDAVIRIIGDNASARIDMRSASRYGRHDFGRNAERLEDFQKMFKARLQATVSIAAERAAARASKNRRSRKNRAKARKSSRRKRRRRRR